MAMVNRTSGVRETEKYTASHEGTLVPTDVHTPKKSHDTYVQDVYTS
jgi:hypothetical protein